MGLRRREAEGRCADLVVVDADLAAEARTFEAVARAMEPITPGVVLERPGVLTFPTRGPSRYFGGDDALSHAVLDAVASTGVTSARAGVADGSFAARLAARTARPAGARIVAPDGSPGVPRALAGRRRAASTGWSAAWPDGREAERSRPVRLVSLLVRLGLPTLGDFAALPALVGARALRADGSARAPARARARRARRPHPRRRRPTWSRPASSTRPPTRVDEAAFAAKGLADRLLARLEALGLACTQVVVEAETEHGEHLAPLLAPRGRAHPGCARRRACAGSSTAGSRRERERRRSTRRLSGGLTLVRLAPDRVVPAAARQLGFWGGDAACARPRRPRAGPPPGDARPRRRGHRGRRRGSRAVGACALGAVGRASRRPRAAGAEVPAWPGAIPVRRRHVCMHRRSRPSCSTPTARPSRCRAAARRRLRRRACAATCSPTAVAPSTAWAGPWAPRPALVGPRDPTAGARSGRWWSGDTVTHQRRRASWRSRAVRATVEARLRLNLAWRGGRSRRAASARAIGEIAGVPGGYLSNTSRRVRACPRRARLDDACVAYVVVSRVARHRRVDLQVAHPVGAVTTAGHQVERVAPLGADEPDLDLVGGCR